MAVVVVALLSAFVSAGAVSAQGQTVTGQVTDAEDGEPLPGVNIVVVGTNTGTTTDREGQYALNVPATADSLSFSFVSYATQTIAIDGRSEIDVALQPQVQQLGDIVVTALGIEREERSLGYAAQEVDAAEIEETGRADVLSALSGKVSGVTITNTGGAPGGSSRIIIRGLTSLNPNANNQPLFVVDGVPIDNRTIEAGDTPRSISNRAADIDPNNVESINILKSGAATALYGTRAANGAVIITTKSGQTGEMKVNISSTASAERVARYPEFQTVYGQGFGQQTASGPTGAPLLLKWLIPCKAGSTTTYGGMRCRPGPRSTTP
jgi:TonB-dependent SusC/RagA subfamily outer membrane receptor